MQSVAAKNNFHDALSATGRTAEIPESADAYGWLIGSWELDVLHYKGQDVAAREIKGEAHFEWVLEGRAVQDVWLMRANADKTMNMYGTTLRVWDPAIQAWRITWTNPAGNHQDQLTGGWSGKDIVQIGAHRDGTPIRWRFTEITEHSFHWLGEALQRDGQTWRLEGEFRAKRLR